MPPNCSLSCLLADSLWTVKFDADGKVLERHETDDPADAGDSKRVRFTHKQLVKLADLDITDDTIPNHAKLPEPQSSSSSSVSITPQMTCFRGAKVCSEWLQEEVTIKSYSLTTSC